MSSQNSNNLKPVHHLALLSYGCALLAKRRVLLLSDDFSMASFIQETGAHQVVAVGAESPAVPWPSLKGRRGMAYQVMPHHDLQFADDAFDAAVVPDLSLFADPAAVIAELGRVVDPSGYLMIAAPNPEASEPGAAAKNHRRLDYYELYELLAQRFPSVQMVGQSPFVGYTVADLACEEDDIEVSFDSDLVGEETSLIEWFVAVCGQTPAALEPLSVIQIPAEAHATSRAALNLSDGLKSEIAAITTQQQSLVVEKQSLSDALAEAKRELGNRGVRIESLEKKLEEELKQSEEARARAVKLAKELDNERKERTKRQVQDEYQKRSQDIDLQSELRDVKKQLRLADERSRSAESARDELIETLRSDAQELDRRREKQTVLEEKLQASQKRAHALTDELQATKARLADGEKRLGDVNGRLEETNRRFEEVNGQLKEANGQLKEANGRLEEANRRFEEANGRFEDVNGRLEDANRRLEEANGPLEEANRRLEEANGRLEDANRRLEDANGRFEEANGRFEEANRQRIDAEQRLVSCQSSDADNAAFVKEIADLSLENASIENQLKETARHKTANEVEIERQNAIIRDLAARIDGLALTPDPLPPSADVEALEIEISALRGARAGHHRARVEAELELSSTALALESARGEMAATGIQLNERDEELSRLRETLATHETTRAMLVADISQTKASLSACEQRIAAYEARTAEAGTELAEVARRSDENGLKMAELAGELQSARWRVDELEARNNALAKHIEALGAEAIAIADERQREAASHAGELDRQQREMQALAVSYANSMESVNALSDSLNSCVINAEQKEHELLAVSDANKKLSALLEALERRERMVEEEAERQSERAKRLREDLDTAVGRNKLLEEEMAGARADRERLEQELGDLTRRVHETGKEKEQAFEHAREAENTAESVVARANAAEVELSAAQAVINGLEKRIALSMHSEAEQVQQVQDELTVERVRGAELREHLERAENRLAEELSRNDGLRAAVELVKAELEAELNLTRMAGADAARISGEAVAIKKKLAKSHRVIDEKDSALEATVTALSALREELVLLSKKRDEAQEARVCGEERCDKLMAEVATLKAEAMNLAAASESKAQAMDGLAEKTRASEQRIEENEAILREAQASIADKAKEIAALQEQIRTSSARLDESEADLNETHAAVADMEAKIVAINQSKVGISVELADAIQHAERLEAALKETKADGDRLTAEMDALRQRLAEAEAAGAEVGALTMRLAQTEVMGADLVALKFQLAAAEAGNLEADALKRRLAEAASAASETAKELDAAKGAASDIIKLNLLMAEKEALIGSLTEQLEERERRAAKLERKNRAFDEQVREHESDVAAWNAELKLRNARIVQLENEIQELSKK